MGVTLYKDKKGTGEEVQCFDSSEKNGPSNTVCSEKEKSRIIEKVQNFDQNTIIKLQHLEDEWENMHKIFFIESSDRPFLLPR